MPPESREWVCLNGRVVPEDEARVSVFDSGFMQGIGLFETMRTYHGRVFRLDEHLARLTNSAVALGWSVVPDTDDLIDAIDKVVAATGGDELRVRLTVTTGSLHVTERNHPALTIVATASAGARYPQEMYTQGATAVVSEYRQNPLDPTVGHKTTSYFSRMASLRAAHAVGAVEALWLTVDDNLAEGAISNVLLFNNEELVTPPLDTPVLPGITRAAVMELAERLNIPVKERALNIEDVLGSEEVLLTNSMMEVMPIVRLGRQRIGEEKPGPVFEELREAYGLLVQQECLDEFAQAE